MPDTMLNKDAAQSIEGRIIALEREKLLVKERIEALMVEMANESGISYLKKRKYSVGYAPNDWSEEDNA